MTNTYTKQKPTEPGSYKYLYEGRYGDLVEEDVVISKETPKRSDLGNKTFELWCFDRDAEKSQVGEYGRPLVEMEDGWWRHDDNHEEVIQAREELSSYIWTQLNTTNGSAGIVCDSIEKVDPGDVTSFTCEPTFYTDDDTSVDINLVSKNINQFGYDDTHSFRIAKKGDVRVQGVSEELQALFRDSVDSNGIVILEGEEYNTMTHTTIQSLLEEIIFRYGSENLDQGIKEEVQGMYECVLTDEVMYDKTRQLNARELLEMVKVMSDKIEHIKQKQCTTHPQ